MYTDYTTYILRDDGAQIPIDENNTDYQAYLAWVAAGNAPAQPPAPTFADYSSLFLSKFSAWMEDQARQNGYDSVLSCLTYVTSSVPQFKGDAVAMLAWRDALWVWAANWQNGMNGQVPATIPTWEDVKAMAPQPEAYGWEVHPNGQIISTDNPGT